MKAGYIFSGRLAELVRLCEDALALIDSGRLEEARERIELLRERLLGYDGHAAVLVAVSGLMRRLAVLRGLALDRAVEKVERLADEVLEMGKARRGRESESRLSEATLDDLFEGW